MEPVDDTDTYIKYIVPMDHEPADEQDVLQQTIDHMSMMGVMVAQTGLVLGQAMMNCLGDVEVQDGETIINHLRTLTHGAADDAPVPVTICCYLARAIKGDKVLHESAEIETVLGIIEEWAHEDRSFADLRGLYSKGIALTSRDVNQLTEMLQAVRKRIASYTN